MPLPSAESSASCKNDGKRQKGQKRTIFHAFANQNTQSKGKQYPPECLIPSAHRIHLPDHRCMYTRRMKQKFPSDAKIGRD